MRRLRLALAAMQSETSDPLTWNEGVIENMKVRLTRRFFHHSQETGLTSKTVFKDYDWNVPPVIGAEVDDSAWHRKDPTMIESINIIADEGNLYYVELNSREVEELDHVTKLVDVAVLHGWKILY